MTLIKSISGIRGTIGGKVGDNLTPIDLVKFSAAYASWLKEECGGKQVKIVLGRDARISGPMASSLVEGTLMSVGADVINIDLATTPTVEMAVTGFEADGGIILTASHNPKQWNALKLLNGKGEFLNDSQGKKILEIAEAESFEFVDVDSLGSVTKSSYDQQHIDAVLALDTVDVEAVKAAGFKVALDAVNSVGGTIIPELLKQMGVEVVELYCTPNGQFPHNPEPLKENLTEIMALVPQAGADLGFVVDPDVDRLAIITEKGDMFGEEYTLVAVADYLLGLAGGGNTVSNMSSSRALSDITAKHGGSYSASAVGEVNVVAMMKETGALIGGEGNGGIIYPELHYGRDALVGVALFLTQLAKSGMSCSQLRATYPEYVISKNKIELTADTDVDAILVAVKERYSNERINDIDGVKIDFADGWVHLRKSNTEPIIRIYSESESAERADAMAESIKEVIASL